MPSRSTVTRGDFGKFQICLDFYAHDETVTMSGGSNSNTRSVCSKTSSLIADFLHHHPDGRQFEEGESVAGSVFEVLGETAAPIEPRESAFDHPSERQRNKTFRAVGALDDFDLHLRQALSGARLEDWPLIAAVGE